MVSVGPRNGLCFSRMCYRWNMCQLVLLLSPWVLLYNGILPASEFWDSIRFFPLEMTLLQQLKPDGDVTLGNLWFLLSVPLLESSPGLLIAVWVTRWPETRIVGSGFLS